LCLGLWSPSCPFGLFRRAWSTTAAGTRAGGTITRAPLGVSCAAEPTDAVGVTRGSAAQCGWARRLDDGALAPVRAPSMHLLGGPARGTSSPAALAEGPVRVAATAWFSCATRSLTSPVAAATHWGGAGALVSVCNSTLPLCTRREMGCLAAVSAPAPAAPPWFARRRPRRSGRAGCRS